MQSPIVDNSSVLTASPTQFYTWQNYRCAYEIHQPINSASGGIPLLLIHPIGVGLSRQFWQRFCREWYDTNHGNIIYTPDLLGCGESDTPRKAYKPIDWAKQLQHFLQTLVKTPVILLVQGALLPVAIELVKLEPNLITGLILSGPTPWSVITKNAATWRQKLLWAIFDSPIGNAFFRYARTRKFLVSFSTERLFAASDAVDEEWLNTLLTDAKNMGGRYAVFSFLARFWQRDYTSDIKAIKQPTLIVLGEKASAISKEGKTETADERMADYLACLSQGRGIKIKGRNVLPYESTADFVAAISPFIHELS
ncbi:alpha/beta hydrolase [Sphaerospermopsis aphanizomenoides BCCUSP55]|uniref:alpha/beta fold hydrolase n=1 Tax=Sphaerospermopsis aphanizomenoides TaxID=459663 RepID=UPI000AFAB675|nr:alpha/beta hydrolase [Sphaerospermopsis aphanizomenoides]MBK1988989.1 alpha/beta hydrolase [Sphaerospermopsis aphanizomenoides BCCUSP55]